MFDKRVFRIKSIFLSNQSNIGNFTWLVGVQLTVAALGFLTQVKIANTLGSDLFGQVAYGILIGSYGAVIVQFGVDRTLTRDILHHPEKAGEIVRGSLALRYLLLLLFAGSLLAFKTLQIGSGMGWGVLLIAVASAFSSLDLRPLYDARKLFKRQSAYLLGQKIIYLSVIWVIVLFFPKLLSVSGIGLAMLATVSFYLFQQHTWAMKNMMGEEKGKLKWLDVIWGMFKKNWIVFIATIGAMVITRMNQLVLKHTAGYAELGAYAAAWQLVLAGNLFLDQVSRIGNPATARRTKDGVEGKDRSKFVMKYMAIMLGVSFAFAVPMIFFPGKIFSIFFNPEYQSAVKLVPIFGVYLMVYSLGIVASQYLINSKMEKKYLFSILLGSVVSVYMCGRLIPRYGLMGAGLALVVSHGFSIGLYFLFMVKNLKMRKLSLKDNF